MNLANFIFGNSASSSFSNASYEISEKGKFIRSNPCALRILQSTVSPTTPMIGQVTVKDSSETIVHLLSNKPPIALSSLLPNPYIHFKDLQSLTPSSPPLLTKPYLTFEDLQFFRVLDKEGMQSKYLSLLNALSQPLEHEALNLAIKQILLLLFYEIDPSVSNDDGETLPTLIAKHQNKIGISQDTRDLLSKVYSKYLLISED